MSLEDTGSLLFLEPEQRDQVFADARRSTEILRKQSMLDAVAPSPDSDSIKAVITLLVDNSNGTEEAADFIRLTEWQSSIDLGVAADLVFNECMEREELETATQVSLIMPIAQFSVQSLMRIGSREALDYAALKVDEIPNQFADLRHGLSVAVAGMLTETIDG